MTPYILCIFFVEYHKNILEKVEMKISILGHPNVDIREKLPA
jgi:hypothetical protein